MKTNSLLGFAVYLIVCANAQGQGTAFTYQGRLQDGGAPANGRYDLEFSLYDTATSGARVAGPVTNTAVLANNGVFVVTLDFGSAAFNGNSRWLQIGVRTNTSLLSFLTLTPRQQITPAPYAVLAGTLSSVLPDSQLSVNIPRLNANQTFSGSITFSGAPTSVSFGSNTRQMMNLFGTAYGIGVQNSTLYTRSDEGFAWFRDGIHSNTANDPGVGGTSLMTLDPSGNLATYGAAVLDLANANVGSYSPGLIFGPNSGESIASQRATNGPNRYGLDFYTGFARRMSIFNNGNVGIGTTNPAALLDVNGKIKMNQLQLGTSATAGQILRADASGNGTWQTALFVSAGDTVNGDITIANPFDINFGSSTRQMMNLFGTVYGFGVQNNTLYARSDGGFAWFRDGAHSNTANDAGTGGATLMTLDQSGNFAANASITVDSGGANSGSYSPGLIFGPGSGEAISSKRAGATATNRFGIDFFTGFANRMSIRNDGRVDLITGVGDIQFRNDGGLVPGINLTGGGIPGVLRLRNALEIWPDDSRARQGQLDVRDTSGNANIVLRGNGTATVKVLEITGGADVAEPFQMNKAEVPKGAVVVIDEDNPGRLRMSDQPYDTRVAGIVSGANGISPGIALHQQGVLEGGQNVALSGRVYALADASQGMIKPGDLLTTSSVPGHAMKASDSAKAHGAVLGKAMSSLKEGKGYVLVLVSLQ